MVHMQSTQPPRPWKHSLCGCFSDCGICCWGYWCPCWLYGDTAKKLDQARGDPDAGCCLDCWIMFLLQFCCLQGFAGCIRRRDLRETYALQGEDCPACCAYTCCGGCAICQDANEFRAWEYDSLQQNAGRVQMTAPVAQNMSAPAPAQAPAKNL